MRSIRLRSRARRRHEKCLQRIDLLERILFPQWFVSDLRFLGYYSSESGTLWQPGSRVNYDQIQTGAYFRVPF